MFLTQSLPTVIPHARTSDACQLPYRIQICENIMKHDTRQKSSGVGARRRRPAVPTLSAVVVVPGEQTLHMDNPPSDTLRGPQAPDAVICLSWWGLCYFYHSRYVLSIHRGWRGIHLDLAWITAIRSGLTEPSRNSRAFIIRSENGCGRLGQSSAVSVIPPPHQAFL